MNTQRHCRPTNSGVSPPLASGEVRCLSNTGTSSLSLWPVLPAARQAGSSHSPLVLATRLLPRARQFVVLSTSGGSFFLSRLRPLFSSALAGFSLRRPACAVLAAFAVPFLGRSFSLLLPLPAPLGLPALIYSFSGLPALL